MAGASFTPAQIDAMPAQDAFALLMHWHDHPPTYEILLAVTRVSRAAPPEPGDPSGIASLIARYPRGTVRS